MVVEEAPIQILFSHQDQDWMVRLRSVIQDAYPDVAVGVLGDHRIDQPLRWQRELSTRTNNATIIVLLISESYLESEFANPYGAQPLLEAARHRGAMVMRVHLSRCIWVGSVIAHYPVLWDAELPLMELPSYEQKEALERTAKDIVFRSISIGEVLTRQQSRADASEAEASQLKPIMLRLGVLYGLGLVLAVLGGLLFDFGAGWSVAWQFGDWRLNRAFPPTELFVIESPEGEAIGLAKVVGGTIRPQISLDLPDPTRRMGDTFSVRPWEGARRLPDGISAAGEVLDVEDGFVVLNLGQRHQLPLGSWFQSVSGALGVVESLDERTCRIRTCGIWHREERAARVESSGVLQRKLMADVRKLLLAGDLSQAQSKLSCLSHLMDVDIDPESLKYSSKSEETSGYNMRTMVRTPGGTKK